MKIVSWTLAGPGTAPIIGDALRSVAPIADARLVVWTGPDPEMPSDFLDALDGVGELGVNVHWWPWRDDFGAARNTGLDTATMCGADFSCMVDTDERVICPDPASLRAWIESLPRDVEVVLVMHEDGSHSRERFFRAGSDRRFRGRTHETIDGVKVLAPRSLIQWSDLPKSADKLRDKFERDISLLRADILDEPNNGAAHYYLAETLQSLGQHEEAIEHFREHNRLSKWEEGRAWAAFKAAESYFALGQPYRVLECAAYGLVHDAGVAELYWIAAVACWAEAAKVVDARGDACRAWEWVEQARCWGESARVHGAGSKAEARRVGKRDVRGLGSGVDEVLRMVVAVGEPRSPA